jgi:hypothetical protein
MTTSGRFWPTPRASPQENRTTKPTPSQMNGTHGRYLASEVLTSSPAASPASRGPQPDDSRAREMTAISGRNLRELFDAPGPVTAFLRMCRESSVWTVGLTGYSLTWIRSATPQGRSLFRLRLSAPTTGGIGSGSLLGTPMANNKVRSAEFAEGRTPNLREVEKAAQMWPTPRYEGFDAGAHRGEPDSLHSAVKMLHTPTSKANQLSPSMIERDAGSYGHGMLPTATAGDAKNAANATSGRSNPDSKHHSGTTLVDMARMLPTSSASDWKGSSQEGQRRGQLSEVVAGQKLSAAWVTRLMGYPDGWMDDLPSDPIGSAASLASPTTSLTA